MNLEQEITRLRQQIGAITDEFAAFKRGHPHLATHIKDLPTGGSGGDADTLDGHDSTYFATASGLSSHTGAANPHSGSASSTDPRFLTTAQLADLTDGGSTTLHSHAAAGGWPATSYSEGLISLPSNGSSNVCGRPWRVAIPANLATISGSKIQVQITAAGTTGLALDHLSVVQQNSGANGTTTPTEITCANGGHGLSIAAGKSLWSDVVSFSWTASAGHLITLDLTNSGTIYSHYNASLTGYTMYNMNAVGAYWDQQNMTPDNTYTTRCDFITAIRVFA